MRQQNRPTVSVIIKALNEERHIATAIESALAALDGLDGEVILADALSTDRTVAIAKKYPITIVRLERTDDRSCGAGAQLGYQYSSGDYLFLMDGDMRLDRDFLAVGVDLLERNPAIGGVGGAVVDREVRNLEYEQRGRRFDPDRRTGMVTRLGGSGLYRRSAIRSVGYVTDRNLHGGEELDLAARLNARNWPLVRIDCHAVDHYVHGGNAFRLLLRRITTRNACGPGELIKAALGQKHFGFALRHDRNSWLCGIVGLWWATMAILAAIARGPLGWTALAAIAIFPLAFMSLRWRSFRYGLYSLAVWNAQALCFLPGFLRRRKPPAAWIASTIVKETPLTQRTLTPEAVA